MSLAKKAAEEIGIKVEIDCGIPFVFSMEDLKIVSKHLIDNKIEGYSHYIGID